jgi:uncharacterized protein (DUF58 family)
MGRGDTTGGAYADLGQLMALERRARGFSLLPKQPVHSVLAGRRSSRLRGRGSNFEEMRRYLPGDDVRNIDWRVTARMRKPFVRVYTEERDRAVHLLVDQRLPMFFGSGRSMKSVAAAELAALGAWRVLAAGDRVGGTIFGDEGSDEIAPRRSRRTARRLLGSVVERNHALSATTETPPRAEALNEALERTARAAPHDSLVVLISDLHGADEETEELITKITRHNDVLIAFVFDELETVLPEVGRVVVSQAGRQLEIDTGSQRLRQRFSADFEERVQRMRALSVTRSVPVLTIDCGKDPLEQLRLALGRRPR